MIYGIVVYLRHFEPARWHDVRYERESKEIYKNNDSNGVNDSDDVVLCMDDIY